jgi:hypothetical protein
MSRLKPFGLISTKPEQAHPSRSRRSREQSGGAGGRVRLLREMER